MANRKKHIEFNLNSTEPTVRLFFQSTFTGTYLLNNASQLMSLPRYDNDMLSH